MTTDNSETRIFRSPAGDEPDTDEPDTSRLADDEPGPDDDTVPDGEPETSPVPDDEPGPDDDTDDTVPDEPDSSRLAGDEPGPDDESEPDGEPEPAEAEPVAQADIVDAELAEPEPVTAAATAAGTAPVLDEATGGPERTAAGPDPRYDGAERPGEPAVEPEAVGAAVAAAPTEAVDDESPAEDLSPDAPLLADADTYRERWTGLQASFVDAPRDAVEGVDRLVEEVGDELARTLATRREHLLARWETVDTSTDELRRAFQEYRALFDRLLST